MMLFYDSPLLTPAHIVLQDNGSTNLVNQSLVLTRLLFESSVQHGLMSQYRSKTLVKIVNGHFRHRLAPSVYELPNALKILAGLPIGLSGLANHDTLHLLNGNIIKVQM